ncbi:MAG: hypothetical protein AAF433_11235 [Bacteroidota bacterium]
MRRFLLLLALAPLSLFSQSLDIESFENYQPRNIGPAGMSGRVTAIDVNPRNTDIIFAGTASGGVWRSTNGGINWEPIFDEQRILSIGAVAVSDANPNIIWVGTGEGNPRNSANYGGGIFRSLDGGDSWEMMGLEATRTIHRIHIDPTDPMRIYVGAQGSQWGPHPERGVYRTTDGGKNWDKILYVDEGTGIADLVMDPTNPMKLIAATWTFDREPWFFHSGGEGSGIWHSHDGGDNWVRVTEEEGLPQGPLGRIGLAIAPSKPEIVYALVEAEKNGLYKSTNGGKDWSLVSSENIGNRPFYYAELYVDPQNENRIYNLWSYVSKSEDGGKTFRTIMDYGNNVHPDHHAFWIDPNDPSYLINGNDGGLNISRDGGENWRFAPNLPLAQFYHINYDMDIPYNVGGGMQDNGSWVGPSRVWKRGGITVADWQEIYFGDGFDVVFQPSDNRYVYAMSQGGNMSHIDRETGYQTFIKPVHPESLPLRFNWNAAVFQSPHADGTLFFGSQYVHKSMDYGRSWEIISPDLTTNDTSKQKQDISGGLTIDATNAENFCTIIAIAQDAKDPNTIWVTTDDGRLQLTRDGGENWTDLANRLPGLPAGAYLPFIEQSTTNSGQVYIVANDYRRNDFRPMVFVTDNYGQSWRRIVDENQVEGHALSIVQDPEEPNLLWLGTDRGLYLSIDGGRNWNHYNEGFPSVAVTDLKIHPREHDLIIGTFGRAAWIFDDIRPFRAMAQTSAAVLNEDFAAFPSPTAYQAEQRSYQGIRFIAQGDYVGRNRYTGALMSYWIKPPADDDEQATDDGPSNDIKYQVVDASGDTIRTFSRNARYGLNRTSWNLRRDGISTFNRRERDEDADAPSGSEVLPGTYTVVMTYGDQVAKTEVVVAADPRLENPPNRYAQRDRLQAELHQIRSRANTSWERLREARASINRVKSALEHAPEELKDTLQSQASALLDSIKMLEEVVLMPENTKGIQRNPNTLSAIIGNASYYVSQTDGAPTQMANISLERARREAATFVEKVNAFLTDDLPPFREQVEAATFSLFGELEPVD